MLFRSQSQTPCHFGWKYINTYFLKRRTAAAAAKSIQLCPTLCDPIDGSPPGSSICGILQARKLEWVAIAFSDELKMEQRSALGFLWKE